MNLIMNYDLGNYFEHQPFIIIMNTIKSNVLKFRIVFKTWKNPWNCFTNNLWNSLTAFSAKMFRIHVLNFRASVTKKIWGSSPDTETTLNFGISSIHFEICKFSSFLEGIKNKFLNVSTGSKWYPYAPATSCA